MKVINKINNNVAICIDSAGKELIAFGKGIGFPKTPYELADLSKITRTFYDINQNYLGLLEEIPEDIFKISAKIVDYAKGKTDNELNPNIVFTLADHINFAIQRYQKQMVFKIPFNYDIQHLYEVEMDIGKKAVAFINQKKQIHLPRDEAVAIALHFINAENMVLKKTDKLNKDKLIVQITELIEKRFMISINKNSFNYSRFLSHIQYLLKRLENNINIVSENEKMFEILKNEYHSTYECALDIKECIYINLGWNLSGEELLYLMLHINRLCSREDCNQ